MRRVARALTFENCVQGLDFAGPSIGAEHCCSPFCLGTSLDEMRGRDDGKTQTDRDMRVKHTHTTHTHTHISRG